ncbi:hypothetical protein [Polycladidibacter stylochi]|uniref:hypothetical protein n=1 Tax=Polycladidibacter stylochi TaxID=1807766 RepID=UPI0008379009|nr:hypothetical protein [Pseudovibrio stylochi]
MRKALIASVSAHVLLLGAGFIALPDVDSLTAEPVESLPVDLVSIEELTKLQQGAAQAKKVKESSIAPAKKPRPPVKKEQPKGQSNNDNNKNAPQKKARNENARAPEPQPAPPQKIEPKQPSPKLETADSQAEVGPEAKKEDKPKQLVKVRPRVKPRFQPQKQEKPKKNNFDPNKIAALLNKTTPSGGGVAQDTTPTSLGVQSGQQNVKLSLSELDALRGQIARCWNPPVGAVGAETLIVSLQFDLSRNGEVQGSPMVLNSISHPAFGAAAQSAIRAVYRCAPYNLPVAKYQSWQTVKINFDPRAMLGY